MVINGTAENKTMNDFYVCFMKTKTEERKKTAAIKSTEYLIPDNKIKFIPIYCLLKSISNNIFNIEFCVDDVVRRWFTLC